MRPQMAAGIRGEVFLAPLIGAGLIFLALLAIAAIVRLVRDGRRTAVPQGEHREGFVESLATNWLLGRLATTVEKLFNLWP